MLPSPRIFRSRWAALLWAGGILWAAVDIAGSASGGDAAHGNAATITDAAGEAANADDLAAVANLIGG
ncbi:hypothetical protein FHT00_000284 [Sphingomonas insulae]|uniref:Uncharacterized protein n=1 Tax=Sphingomonas insulae TaxID=424800 RepID=A0ABP3T4S5_9SPHN|nr:hypothetical protein [Sphingomonas insulae]NIJ28356.1 hypothetical protein [Sphingomonas insulae]